MGTCEKWGRPYAQGGDPGSLCPTEGGDVITAAPIAKGVKERDVEGGIYVHKLRGHRRASYLSYEDQCCEKALQTVKKKGEKKWCPKQGEKRR